jgi:hypothetical protein
MNEIQTSSGFYWRERWNAAQNPGSVERVVNQGFILPTKLGHVRQCVRQQSARLFRCIQGGNQGRHVFVLDSQHWPEQLHCPTQLPRNNG